MEVQVVKNEFYQRWLTENMESILARAGKESISGHVVKLSKPGAVGVLENIFDTKESAFDAGFKLLEEKITAYFEIDDVNINREMAWVTYPQGPRHYLGNVISLQEAYNVVDKKYHGLMRKSKAENFVQASVGTTTALTKGIDIVYNDKKQQIWPTTNSVKTK